MEPDIDQLKANIKRMLARVPARVNAGGYQLAVNYKNDVAQAQKELAKARPSTKGLREVFNKLTTYY